MSIKNLLASILLTILAVSCETYINEPGYPEFEHKFVISSFLSPSDTMYLIKLYSNSPIIGEQSVTHDINYNLKAFLTNGNQEIQLDTTVKGFKFYPKDMLIEEGKTYRLRILNDNILQAEAICTIPIHRDLKLNVDTNTVIGQDEYATYKTFNLNLTLTDFPGENNYYRGFVREIVFYHNKEILSYNLDNFLVSDKGKDGEEIKMNFSTTTYIFDKQISDSSYVVDSSFVEVFLFNTNKDYYDYFVSAEKFSNNGNPFTEPSQVYSNVDGGLGIFCAYTQDTLLLRIH